ATTPDISTLTEPAPGWTKYGHNSTNYYSNGPCVSPRLHKNPDNVSRRPGHEGAPLPVRLSSNHPSIHVHPQKGKQCHHRGRNRHLQEEQREVG
ncbi:unnamed protein product, partial [Ectocarpus sp. 4 AP-2014]